MNFYNQLSCLSDVFIIKCDHNEEIISKINSLDSLDMRSYILKFFIERSVKKAPNIYVDKQELEMVTNPSFKSFDSSLTDVLGLARAHARLEIIGNILLNSYFQETYYEMIEIFTKRLGFTPTKLYLNKLHKLFPNHKVFNLC